MHIHSVFLNRNHVIRRKFHGIIDYVNNGKVKGLKEVICAMNGQILHQNNRIRRLLNLTNLHIYKYIYSLKAP